MFQMKITLNKAYFTFTGFISSYGWKLNFFNNKGIKIFSNLTYSLNCFKNHYYLILNKINLFLFYNLSLLLSLNDFKFI